MEAWKPTIFLLFWIFGTGGASVIAVAAYRELVCRPRVRRFKELDPQMEALKVMTRGKAV